MNELILGIVAGIISNLVYGFLFSRNSIAPKVYIFHYFYDIQEKTVLDECSPSDIRANNRQKFAEIVYAAFEYIFTLALTYCALFIPPIIGNLLEDNKNYLDSAIFIGKFLPHIKIATNEYILFIIAFIFHPFLLAICSITSCFIVEPIMDYFFEITYGLQKRIRAVIFLIYAILILILSISIYFNKTLYDAFLVVAALLFLFLGLSA